MDRDGAGRFQAGNQAAKAKRGYKDRGRQLARLFSEADIEQVYSTLMAKVVEGDNQALSLACKYIATPTKPTLQPTPFNFDSSDPVAAANAVMQAIADGQLPADVGRSILESWATVHRIREVVDLEVRLVCLEEKLEQR